MARKILPEVLSCPSPRGYDCPKLLVSTLTPEKRKAPPRMPRLADSLTTHMGVRTIPPACKNGGDGREALVCLTFDHWPAADHRRCGGRETKPR